MSLRHLFCSAALGMGLLASLPAAADPKAIVAESFSKAFARGSFRAEVSTQVSGKPYRTQMDVQWPNRFHMKTPDTEMIILPGATWMNAGGQWMNMPMDMSKLIDGFSQQSIDQGLASIDEVSELGTADVNGCSSTLYSYSSRGKFMGVEGDSQAEVAICSDTGYPVRLISRDRAGKEQATVHYDFEAAIDIQAPR